MRVASLLPLLAAAFVQFGCVKDNSVGSGPSEKVNGPVFNFETVSTSNLNFSYDTPAGYVVGFEVYAENPFETDAQGQVALKAGVEPIEKGFTNSKGAYNQPLALPAYVEKIYIYTKYAGVGSRFMVAEVKDGIISTPVDAGINGAAVAASAMKSTRAASAVMNTNQTNVFSFGNIGRQTLTLSKWHSAKDGPNPTTLATGERVKIYGRPVEMSYVDKSKFGADAAGKDVLVLNAGVLKAINTALLGDDSGVPVDNKYLKSGDIHVKKEAELDLVFIQNWGAYNNVLAYYCYETANPPANVSDIKYQVIAVPNALEHKFDLGISSEYDVVSMYQGEGVKLKYVDAQGAMHDKFPAGTSVGWILYRNGYSYRNVANDPAIGEYVPVPTSGLGANFSNPAFSKSPNTAVLRYGDFVVVGFDDGDENSGYRDYLDVMFNVQSTPSDAITDEVPDVDPEEPKPVTMTNQGVLLFEDIWPFQGDFDMNDVVVKYVAEKTKNAKNEIVSSKVDFTIFHSGASLNNTFAYVDDNIANADVTFTGGGGAVPEPLIDRTNNIVYVANKLLDYANKTDKVTFTANYTYRTPIPAASYTDAPFNPFILAGGEPGKEVHLTEYKPSPDVNMDWFEKRTHDRSNPELGLFYITFENITAKEGEDRGLQLPWAVNITYDSVEAMNKFRVTQESKPIYKHYLGFTKWVKSEGKENADWYLHYTE